MEQFLFVASAVISIFAAFAMIAGIFGHSVNNPVPILSIWGVEFSHVVISVPAIAYQIYFWSIPLFA